jgi:alkanesulfonate monooxygenase SsuD/methylene tetrahydromethanopterin reductase-like flavin-dependent oxidoreductase (luciferase family)
MRRAGIPEDRLAAVIAGDPDTVGERAQALADVGIEGMTISMADVHDPEAVELAGHAIGPVFASAVA